MEKNIHQIWIGKYDVPKREHEFINIIKKSESNYNHMFWDNNNLPDLPEKVRNLYERFGKVDDFAFQADVLRLFLINTYGGIYLDVDFEYIGGFETMNLEKYDGFFCHHDPMDFTIPNQSFGGKKDHPLFKYLYDSVDVNYHWYGPSWLGETVKKYYGLDYEIDHNILKEKLKEDNILYYPYSKLEKENYGHRSLYSWSPENKKKFKEGGFKW